MVSSSLPRRILPHLCLVINVPHSKCVVTRWVKPPACNTGILYRKILNYLGSNIRTFFFKWMQCSLWDIVRSLDSWEPQVQKVKHCSLRVKGRCSEGIWQWGWMVQGECQVHSQRPPLPVGEPDPLDGVIAVIYFVSGFKDNPEAPTAQALDWFKVC